MSLTRLEEHIVAEFLATAGRLNVVEKVVEQGVDPAQVAEIEDALNDVQPTSTPPMTTTKPSP